jgi:predicted  nucleic acid-binding Zn-ribbon protein
VHPDLAALLALQADDDVVSELEARVEAFQPQVEQLDRALKTAAAERDKARSALDAGEKHEHELQGRVETQRALHEKNLSTLDAVRKPREAAVAMNQAEITRRFLQDIERETQQAVARVVELRARLKEKEAEFTELEESQKSVRENISAQVAALRGEINAARGKRNESAVGVPRSLLGKYEKLRTRRREQSVFAIAGSSCGNCDMALPIQRRNMMVASGGIEVCEACGVLLYAGAAVDG